MTAAPIDPATPDVYSAGAIVRVSDYCRHVRTAERAAMAESRQRIGEALYPIAQALYFADMIDGAQFDRAVALGDWKGPR